MTGPAPTEPAPGERAAPVTRRSVVRGGTSAGGLAARLILTILGAIGLIVGAFLAWLKRASSGSAAQVARQALHAVGRVKGTHLSGKAYFSDTFHAGHFLKSAGFPMIVLGVVALIGLAFRSGWLTRIAGALGIVAFALFGIEVVRSHQMKVANIGIGAWLCVLGAVLALIGGFFGTRYRVEEHRY